MHPGRRRGKGGKRGRRGGNLNSFHFSLVPRKGCIKGTLSSPLSFRKSNDACTHRPEDRVGQLTQAPLHDFGPCWSHPIKFDHHQLARNVLEVLVDDGRRVVRVVGIWYGACACISCKQTADTGAMHAHHIFLAVCYELEGSYGPRQHSRGVGAGLWEGIVHRFL